jgi:hypothetical protein
MDNTIEQLEAIRDALQREVDDLSAAILAMKGGDVSATTTSPTFRGGGNGRPPGG